MKTVLQKYFIFAAVLFLASCSGQPDEETIRIYGQAGNSYANGQFAQTMEILHKQNNFPPALLLRAKAEYFYGDIEKAEKSCRRALRLRPSLTEARFYLARILYEKGDNPGAQAAIESLLADNPRDMRALRLAAEMAGEAGKYDEAVILLDRAAEYSADSAMVLLDRARLRWISGEGQNALEDLSRAKAMLPWDMPLLRSILNLEKTIREVM
ncbi:MAG: tetratricopeptide repeat protein [Treponema sp.]|jgi:uncharacterized protein HemY|nr:tetratricopeptide repeat protein [Treponema sp.]